VGDTLKCVSGDSHPGLLHNRQTGKGFEVTAFDQVEDITLAAATHYGFTVDDLKERKVKNW